MRGPGGAAEGADALGGRGWRRGWGQAGEGRPRGGVKDTLSNVVLMNGSGQDVKKDWIYMDLRMCAFFQFNFNHETQFQPKLPK